jgi:hypothetical protein
VSIPILGQGPRIAPQTRLNVAQMVDETIASGKQLGLKISRIKIGMNFDGNDPVYPLVLEEIEKRGLRIVAINEMAAPTPQGVVLFVSLMFCVEPGQ